MAPVLRIFERPLPRVIERFPITYGPSGIGRNSRGGVTTNATIYLPRVNKYAVRALGESYGCVCVKIVAPAQRIPWICPGELPPRWKSTTALWKVSLRRRFSPRGNFALPRWFIHAFCTRFIRRRLFLLLSVACHVGFAMRSLCEAPVISRDDIRLEQCESNN